MKEFFGGLLSPVADMFYAAVNAIPMWGVRTGVFALLMLLAAWIMHMPPQLPEGRTGEKMSLLDLRFFALCVLILQAVLYMVF